MARSPFVVPILELRHERAEPKPVEVVAPLEWHLEMSRLLPDPPVRADLELVPVSGGILVRGTIDATVRHTCHRCLDEWDEKLKITVAQLFEGDGDDEVDYTISGAEIDLEPMIRDEVLLALPLVPTCRDECRGVVAAAESDLNTTTPDDLGEPASPFAVLKDLLKAGD